METALSYSGAMRAKYILAAEALSVNPIDYKRDARLSCFLKAEKVDTTAKWPKPRVIFPREPRYNLALASRLKPFEHWLWRRCTAKRLGVRFGVGRLCAKGLNLTQRAELIRRKMAGGRVAVEVDGSAFEAHVGPSQLEIEHAVYHSAYPRDTVLRRLLLEQVGLKGRMPCGVKFERDGGRASGDFNTGMGNSIVMMCVVFSVMFDFAKWDTLVDGDNALLFVEPADLDRLRSVVGVRALRSCGQELTVEKPTAVLEEVVFGQSRPVWFPSGWRLVRSPFKAMSGMTSSHAWLREPIFRREYLAGVAKCELSLAAGEPLVQAACLAVLKLTGDVHVRDHIAYRDYAFLGASVDAARVLPIHPRTRTTFARAFGISEQCQVRLESLISRQALFPVESGYSKLPGVVAYDDAFPGMPCDLL